MTPFRVEPVGPLSQESERKRGVGEVREARGFQQKINRLNEQDPKEKQRLRERARKELEKRQQRESKRAVDLRGR